MTDRDSRLAVRVAVTFAVVAGASCSGFIVATTWRRGIGDPRIFALGFAALALVNIFPIIFEWKGHAEHVSVDETLYATLVMVAPPIVPLLAMVFGSVVGNVYHRRPLIKVAFNISIIGLSTSAALGVSRLVAGQLPVGTAWRGLLGAAAGALACYATTTLAVRVMVAIADQVPVHQQFSGTSLLEIMLVSTTVSMGLLGGLASGTQALSLLFVLPPLAIIGVVLHQHARAVRDRHKLDRLLETAVVVNRASGPNAVRAVLLDAACSLLHTDNSRMQADPPEDHELGSRVVTDSNELWLVASPRTRNQTFTGEDQSVLDGVAAIASSSLGSAELLERVRHQAFHDSLTGLPNRLLFEDRVQQALRVAAGREGAMVAVLFIDLDRFKRVNDSLGHHTGDTLLQDVAERLQSALRVCDSAARVGGDEFVVLVPELGSEEAALEIAERLISVMRIPYRVGHREIVVTASVGVAISPRDGRDDASLLCIADLAMYEAKAAGRNVVRCLSAGTSAEGPTAEGQFALEVDLRRAMQHDELWVAYQPQIDIATRRMVGVEALVRWTHPTRGLITPDEFLPLAEELGMIGAIDEWVLASACHEAAAWRALGGTDLRVSVNLSERHLQSGRIYTLVTDVLAETGLPANRLELEVTEKVVATQGATGDEALARLRQHGVRVAIDDFGTGYSSLSRLGSLPVDIVKIDQSFMAEVIDLTTPVPLVSSAIAMGHGLGLEVIAEGVETREQLQFLANEGCDLVQGFLLGRPMTAAELRSRLLFDATIAARAGVVGAR